MSFVSESIDSVVASIFRGEGGKGPPAPLFLPGLCSVAYIKAEIRLRIVERRSMPSFIQSNSMYVQTTILHSIHRVVHSITYKDDRDRDGA